MHLNEKILEKIHPRGVLERVVILPIPPPLNFGMLHKNPYNKVTGCMCVYVSVPKDIANR